MPAGPAGGSQVPGCPCGCGWSCLWWLPVRACSACPLVWSGLSGCCLLLAARPACSGSFARAGSWLVWGPYSCGRSSPVPVACRRRCGVVARLAPDRPAPGLLGPLDLWGPLPGGGPGFSGGPRCFRGGPGAGRPLGFLRSCAWAGCGSRAWRGASCWLSGFMRRAPGSRSRARACASSVRGRTTRYPNVGGTRRL